jgi:chromosome segregation ATPase
MAAAAVASKSSLIQENTLARDTIATLQADLDYARAELATAQGEITAHLHELATLRAEREELRAALTAAATEAQTAEAAAAAIVSTLGVDPTTLPTTALPGESREELIAAMNAEQDPTKRYELAERINAL